MKYLEPSFSTMAPPGKEYRDSWDRIFGKKNDAAQETSGTVPTSGSHALPVNPSAGGFDLPLAGALCTCNLEPSFMVDKQDEDERTPFYVYDAECELVATCREARYAMLIANTLEDACNDNWIVCLVHPEGT